MIETGFAEHTQYICKACFLEIKEMTEDGGDIGKK